MTLEGFGYKDSSESDDSSEESTHAENHRPFRRPMRPPIPFVRRESTPPPAHEHPRTPLFNMIDSRSGPTAPIAEHAPAHVVPAPGHEASPSQPAVPPEVWQPDRALVFNVESDTDEDEDEPRTEAAEAETVEREPGEPRAAEPTTEAPAPDLFDRIEAAAGGGGEEPPEGPFPPGVGEGALPPEPEPIPDGYEPMLGAIRGPEARAEYVTHGPVPAAEYVTDPPEDAPVSPAAAAWHPAWREPQAPSHGDGFNQEQQPSTDQQRERRFVEVRNQRSGAVVGLITGLLIARHFAKKNMKQYSTKMERRMEDYGTQVKRLETGHDNLLHQLAGAEERFKVFARNQPPAARFERPMGVAPNQALQPHQPQERLATVTAPEAVQAVQTAAEAAALVAEAYNQQPKQHIQSSEWHRVKVDQHGHEIQGAMEYGQEYHHERSQEQGVAHQSATPVASNPNPNPNVNTSGNGGGIITYGGGIGLPTSQAQGLSGGVNPMLNLPSGQADYAHELPASQSGYIDPQHRLDEPAANPLTTILTSPLIWVGLTILLLAFFAAAFL